MASNKTTETETQILSSFLLSRASLKDIITLRDFTDLFPRDKRSNPQIRLLYRELQLARNRQLDHVKRKIKHEALSGSNHRKTADSARRRDAVPDDETMCGVEVGLTCLGGGGRRGDGD